MSVWAVSFAVIRADSLSCFLRCDMSEQFKRFIRWYTRAWLTRLTPHCRAPPAAKRASAGGPRSGTSGLCAAGWSTCSDRSPPYLGGWRQHRASTYSYTAIYSTGTFKIIQHDTLIWLNRQRNEHMITLTCCRWRDWWRPVVSFVDYSHCCDHVMSS